MTNIPPALRPFVEAMAYAASYGTAQDWVNAVAALVRQVEALVGKALDVQSGGSLGSMYDDGRMTFVNKRDAIAALLNQEPKDGET